MNSAAYARRQVLIRKPSPGETTYDPHATHKVCIADLILVYGRDGISIQHILDVNSKPWFRQMPESLAKVRQAATLLYRSTKTRIRCPDCGKLKSQKDLQNVGGRCPACGKRHIEYLKAHPQPEWRETVHFNPDDPRPWPNQGRG